MKRLLVSLALTCALSASVLAGDIPTCGTPGLACITTEKTIPGDIPISDSTSPGDMPTVGFSAFLTILDLVF
jgi:hypothetical protein